MRLFIFNKALGVNEVIGCFEGFRAGVAGMPVLSLSLAGLPPLPASSSLSKQPPLAFPFGAYK
jgi:hypothetical protein